jgi:RNA polymerase sigma-70 factor (ECF subfamily)
VTGTEAREADAAEIERVFREASGQAVATLIRVFGDITLAEDAVQDAFAVASERWPRHGLPPNPAGWIVTTARRRAINHLRRDARGQELQRELAATDDPGEEPWEEGTPVQDDRLRLIFTCCHPALRPEHQVALTLRLLGGLRVDEVARAFLVSEAAMAKRLVRAKYKIKAARIPYREPDEADLPSRLASVLSVLFLIYNAGLEGSDRATLRAEANRLPRVLVALMPDEPEAGAARVAAPERVAGGGPHCGRRLGAPARAGPDGVGSRADLGGPGDRACLHPSRPARPLPVAGRDPGGARQARRYEETDWPQILALYDQLLEVMPTPVVALNRAIAVAEVEGPEAALAILDVLTPHLDGYHLLHAARGTMLRQLSRIGEARAAFERAADLAPTEAERRSLARQADRR